MGVRTPQRGDFPADAVLGATVGVGLDALVCAPPPSRRRQSPGPGRPLEVRRGRDKQGVGGGGAGSNSDHPVRPRLEHASTLQPDPTLGDETY